MPDRLLPHLRVLFLVAAAGFGWFGLRGRFGEIGEALGQTSVGGVLAALVLVLLGLGATGFAWLRIMACLGVGLPLRDGLATFFVGQLGKYIPGSVWSLGAQAQMAGRHVVPPRATVAAGLVFLGYHLVTGVVVGLTVVLLGGLEAPWPSWLSGLGLLVALASLTSPVVELVTVRLARRQAVVTLPDTGVVLGLMTFAWAAYSSALVLLEPDLPWPDVTAYGAAFALAYAVGVVVVVAPAGVGAREAVFVLLLAPVTTVAGATALALLARALHTVADGLMAALAWSVARRTRAAARELEG